MPFDLVEKYFTQPVHEYQCDQSGLRWYAPSRLGESDFYEWLAREFPWYYSPVPTWDKIAALDFLQQTGTCGFVEIGSGGGNFLKLAREKGIEGIGIEINVEAIRSCRGEGLQVYHVDEEAAMEFPMDTLVSLQSLEHVSNPVEYMRSVLEKFPARHLIIAVPCFETLLGHTLDPLAWPPHHYTAWSRQALETFGELLGYHLDTARYEPLRFSEFNDAVQREQSFAHSKIRNFARLGPLNRVALKLMRKLGIRWLSYRHSIAAILTRSTL